MARQKTKLSDRFGSGGNKENSPEDKFFSDADIQIDPEWKVIELLRAQLDDVTDVINANDAASGSYATLKGEYVTSSGSFSTRVTTNDAKTGITSGQASAITANTEKDTYDKDLSDTALKPVKLTVTLARGAYSLVFTMTHGSTVKRASIALK